MFTNLTREHMDYHKNFDDYFAAKRTVVRGTGAGAPDAAIINIDDEYGKRLARIGKNVVTYGLGCVCANHDEEISADIFRAVVHGANAERQSAIASPLVGRINVYNMLAAIGAAQALGISNESIAAGIQNLESVPGDFSGSIWGSHFLWLSITRIPTTRSKSLIRTARELNPKGRIITLFGCGGWKDRTKRPVMGEVSGRLSDLTILANDNPRTEDPLKIISDIIVGLQKANGEISRSSPTGRKRSRWRSIKRGRATSCCSRAKATRTIRFWPTGRCILTIAKRRGEVLRERGYDEPPRPQRGGGKAVWHLARFR